MEYTREQEQAIYSRGSDILVSAGAGAGKTRVLVSRISELIEDKEHPVSADQLLVLTFTNAAAREMKERIVKELEERLLGHPENDRLRQQVRVVKHADISTVHSFCNKLLRRYFNEIGLDPAFRIGEEGELKLLKKEAMDQLLEHRYQEGEESFLHFVEAYAPGRDDTAIEAMISNLYTFSRGFPDAEGWFARLDRDYQAMLNHEDGEDSSILQLTMQHARGKLGELLPLLDRALHSFGEDREPEKVWKYISWEQEMVARLAEAEHFDELYELLHEISFPSYPQKRGKLKEWLPFDSVKAVDMKVRETVKELQSGYFTKSMSAVRIELRQLYPYFRECLSLVTEYEKLYFAGKCAKNLYDFDDLEHLTLKILVDHYEEDGRAVPSRIAGEIAAAYPYIFVDEYQDTNMVQETLINVLMDAGDSKLFVVGDVKQSIYRFRQARPDLFLDRYHRYEQGEGLKIELRDNFRSSPDVLAFCNLFFQRWMSRDFGGIDYDEQVRLRAGEGGPLYDFHSTQETLLLIKDDEAEALGEDLDQTLAEAVMIGEKIQSLHQEGYGYEDMVILLRSVKSTGQLLAEYLESIHIPVLCESQVGYFQTREIRVMLNYLTVIDNIYQDIPMASVMLSGIGGFCSQDLAELKILVDASMRKHDSLYELMGLYLREGRNAVLREKIRRFLAQLQDFRSKRQEMLLHELIWEIYQKTGFYEEVLSMPQGEKRRENLMMLLHYAEDYEKTIYKGLFYFIRHMEQLRSYELEPGGGSVQDSMEDAVRIMTIHKSKGLEYPVVFISNLSKRFNQMDLREKLLLHPRIGIGLEICDLQERSSSPSIMKKAIRDQLQQESLEEELRILYVAMTRAQKKLVLTGVVKEKKMEEVEEVGPTMSATQASCYLDWLLPVLYEQTWQNCRIYHYHEMIQCMQEEMIGRQSRSLEELVRLTEGVDTSMVRRAYARSYPYEASVSCQRKFSVSELKKLWQLEHEEDGQTMDQRMVAAPCPQAIQKEEQSDPLQKEENAETAAEEEALLPAFLREEQEEISPTMYGTMVHKVMELLPFALIKDKKSLYDQLSLLWETIPDMEISVPMRKKIYRGVEAFLFSPEGSRVIEMDKKGQLFKEYPFTIGLPASFIYGDGADQDPYGGDIVVIQGIIDLCGRDEDGWWLLDYKTDKIREGEEQKLDQYKAQMLYYKIALEQMMHEKVTHAKIYSFALMRFRDMEV